MPTGPTTFRLPGFQTDYLHVFLHSNSGLLFSVFGV